jgi:anti-sigma-K factor RskA
MSGWSLDYDDDIAIAAEYVLGLLPPEELAQVEERLAVDPAFRDLVARWADDFASLTDDIPAVAPPAAVEGRVMRRLFGEPEPQRRWSLWPALLGGALAAGLAIWALNPAFLSQSEPDYAALIAAEDGSLVVQARFDADTRRLEVQRTAGEVPEGQDLELWLVYLADSTTTSLGVLPRDAEGVIEVSADLAAQFEDNALALSVEPLGGSPTGQATGPVVALGPITGL